MENIENEYNKRFEDKELSNDNFDVEGLWDAITDDLDKGDAKGGGQPQPSLFTPSKYFGVILLFFGLVATFLLYYSWNADGQNGTKNDWTANENEERLEENDFQEDKESSVVVISEDEVNGNNQELFESSIGGKTNTRTQNNIAPNSSKITVDSEKKTKSLDLNTSIPKTNIVTDNQEKRVDGNEIKNGISPILKTDKEERKDIESIVDAEGGKRKEGAQVIDSQFVVVQNENGEKTINPSESDIQEPTNQSFSTGSQDIDETQNRAVLASDNILANQNTTPTLSEEEVKLFETLPRIETFVDNPISDSAGIDVSPKTIMVKDKEIRWHLGLYGGMNTSILNFSSSSDNTLATEKNIAEQGFFGTNLGLNTMMIFKEKWLVRGGVEYQKTWTKFDYEIIENTIVNKPQVLLRVVIDPNNGNTVNQIFGDTVVNRTETRTITHYNLQQFFSLPLEFGWQRKQKVWRYGILGGAIFNFRINQKGRTLDANLEVISYGKNDPASLSKSFGIGWRISPFLAYDLNKKIAFSIQPKWTLTQNAIFNASDLKVSSQQLQINIGAQFKF